MVQTHSRHSSPTKNHATQLRISALLSITVLAVFFANCNSFGQSVVTFNIPRVNDAPVINGEIDGDEWLDATRIDSNIEIDPRDSVEADVKSHALLMEDGEKLYVLFVAEDPDPENIRAFYRDRDNAFQDDWMSIVLDTFNDERRAYEFFVNPLGVQIDAIYDDVNQREDSSWNGIWESEGTITDSGYLIEVAIPLRQLRFSPNNGKQTWGIDIARSYPRNRGVRMRSQPQDRNISCYLCQLSKIEGFADLEPGRNLEIIPTFTSSSVETRDIPKADWLGGDIDYDGGLDVRWGIAQDTYLNATINPDFSQVEADSAQLDINNTFSLFFPERRTFFLDGADYFDTDRNLVHTRNIADPEYGAKLTGKTGNHTYGLLTANDETTSFIIPQSLRSRVASLDDFESDVAIGRYRYDIFGNSTVGALVTDRSGNGYRNTVVSLDTVLKPTDQDTISIQAMHSSSDYPVQIQNQYGQENSIDDDNLYVQYNHNDRRWDWRVGYWDIGSDFRADLGFVNRVDIKHFVTTVGHTWRSDGDSFFTRFRFAADYDRTEDQSGLKLEEEVEFFINAEGPMQSFWNGLFGGSETYWNGQYFDEQFNQMSVTFSPTTNLRISNRLRIEDIVDFANTRLGRSKRWTPGINYRWGRHLELDLDHTIQHFDVDGGRLFTANLTDLRTTYQFSVRSFLRFTLQHQNNERNQDLYQFSVQKRNKELTTQLLYSYKLNAATRFFLGYSDAGFQNDSYDSIAQTNRTFFLKLSYGWQP